MINISKLHSILLCSPITAQRQTSLARQLCVEKRWFVSRGRGCILRQARDSSSRPPYFPQKTPTPPHPLTFILKAALLAPPQSQAAIPVIPNIDMHGALFSSRPFAHSRNEMRIHRHTRPVKEFIRCRTSIRFMRR